MKEKLHRNRASRSLVIDTIENILQLQHSCELRHSQINLLEKSANSNGPVNKNITQQNFFF